MLIDNNYCFGCGASNPIGLCLKFEYDEKLGEYSTVFVPKAEHQGWSDRVHGGLLALVFDEVLSRVALTTISMDWVTAELTTRMLSPALIGKPLIFKARITSRRSRLVMTSAEAIDENLNVIATATAKLMKPH
jgi:acyl-coenzyme A thioesterase PaaI-like protein